MHKGFVLSAGIILAGAAPAAASAPHALVRNVDVVAMPSPLPVSGTVRVIFFAPGSAALTPMAQRIVASTMRQAGRDGPVTLVVAEAAGLKPVAAAVPVWRARVAAVRRAIVHSPAGQLSENRQDGMRLGEH